jgi:hypothetical protein
MVEPCHSLCVVMRGVEDLGQRKIGFGGMMGRPVACASAPVGRAFCGVEPAPGMIDRSAPKYFFDVEGGFARFLAPRRRARVIDERQRIGVEVDDLQAERRCAISRVGLKRSRVATRPRRIPQGECAPGRASETLLCRDVVPQHARDREVNSVVGRSASAARAHG